jgi:hypothetical protein
LYLAPSLRKWAEQLIGRVCQTSIANHLHAFFNRMTFSISHAVIPTLFPHSIQQTCNRTAARQEIMVWQQRRFRGSIYQDRLKQILSRCQWCLDKEALRHAIGVPNTSDGRFDEWEGRHHWFGGCTMAQKDVQNKRLGEGVWWERCWDESGTATRQDRRMDRWYKWSWEYSDASPEVSGPILTE